MRLFEITQSCECPEPDDNPERTECSPIPILSNHNDVYSEILDAATDMSFEYAAHQAKIRGPSHGYHQEFYASMPLIDVPIRNIVGTENCVDPRGTTTNKPPTLAKYKSVYVVADGNHRVAQAIKDGLSTIKARVVDIENK